MPPQRGKVATPRQVHEIAERCTEHEVTTLAHQMHRAPQCGHGGRSQPSRPHRQVTGMGQIDGGRPFLVRKMLLGAPDDTGPQPWVEPPAQLRVTKVVVHRHFFLCVRHNGYLVVVARGQKCE